MNSESKINPTVAHQKLYKHCSPNWKAAYRKRCQDRLRGNRDKFISKFRNVSIPPEGACAGDGHSVIKDLMVDEWQKMATEESGLPTLSTEDMEDIDFDNLKDGNIDEFLSIFEEIRKELLLEEREILAEYEAGICFEECALSATLDCLRDRDDVLCPVCNKDSLHLNKGIIFCQCGVRIDTEQDCIDLGFVKHNIMEGVQSHEMFCEGKVTFSVRAHCEGINNLIMDCPECDCMYIVV